MRILCIGDIQLASALRELGHELHVLGCPDRISQTKRDSRIFFERPAQARQLVAEAVAAHKPEVLIVGDDSSPLLHLGLEHYELPRLWWSIDTHLHVNWHRHFSTQFHRVMGAQRPFLKELRDSSGRPAKWLPLFFPAAIPFTPWPERRGGVTFVGTLDKTKNPRRVAFFEALSRRLPVQVLQGDYRKIYRNSQIVINQAVAGDLNYRLFEAMGCGAALVTENLPQGFRDIATPGEEFLTYAPGDVEDAAKAIESLLAEPARCEQLARAGYEKINQNHLAMHRALFFDGMLKETASSCAKATPEAKDRLAYAHWVVARLNYPEPLRVFFASEALRRATAYRNRGDHPYPWSHLILAESAVQAGQWKKAGKLLKAMDPPDDTAFMEVFAPIRAVVAAQAMDQVEALYWVRRGLRVAPANTVLLEMDEKLKLG